jgi:Protein of unknown function (DUF3341)
MSSEIQVIASFTEEEFCEHAVAHLRNAGIENFRVFAPFPIETIQQELGRGISPVRLFVLLGGIAGVLTGFAVTAGTSMEWNLVAGGKPVISLPPFIIIMFELMVLFGGTFALLSFFFFATVPRLDPVPGYSERFSADRFGIAVPCASDDETQIGKVESILREAGAEEVARDDTPGQTVEA